MCSRAAAWSTATTPGVSLKVSLGSKVLLKMAMQAQQTFCGCVIVFISENYCRVQQFLATVSVLCISHCKKESFIKNEQMQTTKTERL